jgi:hypothetical protein
MPFDLKRLSLKGDKSDAYPPEKMAPVASSATSTNGKEAPPSYAPNDPITEPSAAEMNAAFANLSLPDYPPGFPSPDHCLAHLKLLSAFKNLKEDVGYTDGLFNLWDAKCELVESRDEALAKMREKRWALYIARAVERFEAWWLQVLCTMEPQKRLEIKEIVAGNLAFVGFPGLGKVQRWNPAMLPPIGKNPP